MGVTVPRPILTCDYCLKELPDKPYRGRPPRWCGDACRSAFSRNGGPKGFELPPETKKAIVATQHKAVEVHARKARAELDIVDEISYAVSAGRGLVDQAQDALNFSPCSECGEGAATAAGLKDAAAVLNAYAGALRTAISAAEMFLARQNQTAAPDTAQVVQEVVRILAACGLTTEQRRRFASEVEKSSILGGLG